MITGMAMICLAGAWAVARRLGSAPVSRWAMLPPTFAAWLTLPHGLRAVGVLGLVFPVISALPAARRHLDRVRRREAFPVFLESLALFLRSGLTFPLAVSATQSNLPPPLVRPVRRLHWDLEQSLSMREPLQRFADELDFSEARMFAGQVDRQLVTGMSVREVVERLRLEMETSTAQARRRHLASIPYLLGMSVGLLLVDTVIVLAYPRIEPILRFLLH